MLHHPTLEKLQTLRLMGMYKALTEQMAMPESETLSFEERLGLLVDRELTERQDRRLQTRLHQARLKHNACVSMAVQTGASSVNSAVDRQRGW